MKTLTPQQKLEILCAYLPHGVRVVRTTPRLETGKPKILTGVRNNTGIHISMANKKDVFWVADIDSYSLILRHPDDMTDEELVALAKIISYGMHEIAKLWLMGDPYGLTISETKDALNYLHSIHIDTFGAIEAGFAVRKNINEKG